MSDVAGNSGARSPLAAWFAGPAAIERFRRRALGRMTDVRLPRDRSWGTIAPDFDTALDLARAGVPFQTAIDRRYDRSSTPAVLRRALREGQTIFFPQVHQVLPRLARFMVAVRVALLGPSRLKSGRVGAARLGRVPEQCSYLFAVEGRGREGMGLHHDGDVDAFWLQLEGRRTVTIGPPVTSRTPLDLPDAVVRSHAPGWRTIDLTPGTLFYLPPRTPHRVVCHGRSLAISLTWTRSTPRRATRRQGGGGRRRRPDTMQRLAATLAAWDVTSGRADAIPRPARDRLWLQVPVVAGPIDRRRREFALWTDDGEAVRLPARLSRWATALAVMPSFNRSAIPAAALGPLLRSGILAPVDLPQVVRPARPRALDGWRFA